METKIGEVRLHGFRFMQADRQDIYARVVLWYKSVGILSYCVLKGSIHRKI